MPHITLEYSDNLSKLDVSELLKALHDGLAGHGIDKSRIKTRAHALRHYIVGDKGTNGQMAHITVLLLEGREVSVKKAYGDALYELAKDQIHTTHPTCAVTLEIRDMNKDTYYM